MKVDVAIIGGGLAGLFSALSLRASGVDDVVVLEKSAIPGGVARTIDRDGYKLETGAGSFQYPGPHLGSILDAAGVEVGPAQGSEARFVFDGAGLVELRSGPGLLRTPLVSTSEKARAMLEPLLHGSPADEDETVESFFVRHFGRGVGKKAAWLAASGVFAGDPGRLSLSSAFPRLHLLEQTNASLIIGGMKAMRSKEPGTGSSTHIPVGGMTSLANSLAGSLGDRFRPGFEVKEVCNEEDGSARVMGEEEIEAREVIFATSPGTVAHLLQDDQLATSAGEVRFSPVVVAGLGGPADDIPLPDGFGALVMPRPAQVTRGVLFESSYAPDRAPHGNNLAKVIAGGTADPSFVDRSDDAIIDRLTTEVSAILGNRVTPGFAEIFRHEPGIPQYEVGHGRVVADIEARLASLGPYRVIGWGYRGIGVTQLASESARLVREMAGHR